jgi:hypothetical protein
MPPRPPFQIQPGDVPLAVAAHRMGMAVAAFEAALPRLFARGFPRPDPDTANFDLEAIDAWRRARHHHLYGNGGEFGARDASDVVGDRIAALRGGQRR